MLFAQDGHQTSEKIKRGLEENLIDGAIFCPRTHSSENLIQNIKACSKEFSHKNFFLDPNFYVGPLSPGKTGKLDSYPFFHTPLRKTNFTSKNIQKYVKDTIDYQIKLGLTNLISPGVIIPSFNSDWSQIALQLFAESIDYVKSKKTKSKLFLCLPIRESALREDEQLSEYLDGLTTLEADGFYIFVERATKEFLQWSDPSTLAGLLYLVRALSNNDYQIIIGYIDIVGLILRAVGADAIANGWWKNLKQFTRDRFEQSGERPPRPIYTSGHLLGSIFIETELQPITEVGLAEEILSKTAFDSKLTKNPASQSWSNKDSILHHWAVLKNLETKIEEADNSIDLIKQWIDQAQALYVKIKSHGINLEAKSEPSHLKVWKEAITLFEKGDIL